MTDRIFISYSRREFFFAEALAIRLQHAGFPVWFDSQQIALGEDWAKDIQQGLIDSGAMVLVASRASLASPYVAKEWAHVLETGKPLHLLIFEPVKLPPELEQRAASITDASLGFEAAFPRLLAHMRDGGRDALPRAPRFPSAVWAVAWHSLLGLLLMLTILPLLGQSPGSELMLSTAQWIVLIALFLEGRDVRRLLRREFDHPQVVRLASPHIAAATGAFAVGSLVLGNFQITQPFWLIPALIAGVLYARTTFLVLRHWRWHLDLLCWYPLTAQPAAEWRAVLHRPYLDPSMDIQINAPVRQGVVAMYPTDAKAAPAATVGPAPISTSSTALQGKTFALHYAPHDQKEVKDLNAVLGRFGMRAVQENPDLVLLYLTHRTPRQFAYDLCEAHPNLICILGESTLVPQDAPASFRGIQWFDYRPISRKVYVEGDQETGASWQTVLVRPTDLLYGALNAALHPEDSVRAVYTLNTTPPQLSRPQIAQELRQTTGLFSATGTGCLTLALMGTVFLWGIVSSGGIRPEMLLLLLIVVPLVANAAFFYRSAFRAGAFQPVSRTGVIVGMLGGLGLVFGAAWVGLILSPEPLRPDRWVVLIVLVLVWIAVAVALRFFTRADLYQPVSDAFGAPPLRLTRLWVLWQLGLVVLSGLVLYGLWRG